MAFGYTGSMSKQERLLSLLSDGRFHSGAALGEALGIGRSAVWKQMRRIEARGLEIHAVRGKGYRLATPIELLDREVVRAGLAPSRAARLRGFEIFQEIDSTNRYLADLAAQGAAAPYLCLAETQTAGRGRRGRRWLSPFGRNLYLSLLWRFEHGADDLSGLSLAAGAAVAAALDAAGVPDIGLKWPNDLFYRDAKLGGLLIELSGEASGPWCAVVGVGLNVDMRGADLSGLDQPWTDLRAALGRPPSRNRLAAGVVDALLEAMPRFERAGFAPFRETFERFDIVCGREVDLHFGNGRVEHGRVRGVGEHGALLFESESGLRQVTSAEISLRIA